MNSLVPTWRHHRRLPDGLWLCQICLPVLPKWQPHKQPPRLPSAALAPISVSARWHPSAAISCWCWQSPWCLMLLHGCAFVVGASPGSQLHLRLFSQQFSPARLQWLGARVDTHVQVVTAVLGRDFPGQGTCRGTLTIRGCKSPWSKTKSATRTGTVINTMML